MALVPIRVGEKLRIIEVSRNSPLQRQIDDAVLENWRVSGVVRRRKYVGGEQYDSVNFDKFYELKLDPLCGDLLPEHEKKLAYSIQVGESVKFIADQLAEEFHVVAKDASVQAIIDAALRQSLQLSGSGDDDDVSVEELLEEVLTAGDVPVELRWDPEGGADGLGAVFFDLWESELVEIEWADRDTMEVVKLREIVWRWDPEQEQERQVEERVEWEMLERVSDTDYATDPDTGATLYDGDDEPVPLRWLECQRRVFWDNEENPREETWTGLPMIPWRLLRGDRKGLRAHRGQSLVTDQVMNIADRYNAVENIGYIIARHNSHSNLAVVGDAATLKMDSVGYLDKDVDDVLGFPGGTALTSLSLPTDPQMIEHQRKVLTEAIYAAFGLTRVEPDTLEGLGAVSGYALEILNRKSEGTFRKIRRHFTRDLRTLFDATITLYEALTADPGDVPMEDGFELDDVTDVPPWVYEMDEPTRFDNREMEIRMGSGFVVDEVLIREDYNADLISRAEALRQRGKSNPDITKIEREIAAEKTKAAESFLGGGGETGRFRGQSGRTQGQNPSDDPPGGTVTE